MVRLDTFPAILDGVLAVHAAAASARDAGANPDAPGP
jgi:hypothetical protein